MTLLANTNHFYWAPAHQRFGQVLMAGLLVVSATETDAILGLFIQVPQLRLVSMAALGLYGIYLATHASASRKVLRSPLVRLWTTLLLGLPVFLTIVQSLAGLYPLDRAVYWLAVLLLNGMCFLAAIVWASRATDRATILLLMAMLGVCGIGFVVQYVNYDVLRAGMAYSSNVMAASLGSARLLGFFAHPNGAAIALVIMAVPVLTSLNGRDGWTPSFVAFSLCVLCAILATGSRTSLALWLLALALIGVRFAWRSGLVSATRGMFYASFIAFMAILSILFVWPLLAEQNNAMGLGIERLARLFDDDPSVALRIGIVWPYVEASLKSPLLGLGHHWLAEEIGNKSLPLVSQNTWLQWAVQYGWLYVAFSAFVFFRSLLIAARHMRRNPGSISRSAFGLLAFLVIALAATFSLNDIFLLKSVGICFGLLLGIMIRHWSEAQS